MCSSSHKVSRVSPSRPTGRKQAGQQDGTRARPEITAVQKRLLLLLLPGFLTAPESNSFLDSLIQDVVVVVVFYLYYKITGIICGNSFDSAVWDSL